MTVQGTDNSVDVLHAERVSSYVCWQVVTDVASGMLGELQMALYKPTPLAWTVRVLIIWLSTRSPTRGPSISPLR